MTNLFQTRAPWRRASDVNCWARNKKSFVKISIIMLLAACGLAAADSKELEPLPLEEAKAIAVKFDSLRPGMSPEQVGSALGLETVTERIISFEAIRAARSKNLNSP